MAAQSSLGRQIAEIVAALNQQGVPFALIGGLALSAHKVVRATTDIDLLAPAARSSEVDAIATKLGYRCVYRNEGLANYLRAGERLDLLWASRPPALRLLSGAMSHATSFGELPVVSVEGLIGFKLQALVNQPSRTQDLEDIRALLKANRDALDLAELREYFRLFDRESLLTTLLDQAGAAGVRDEAGVYADPYARLDDLMCVIEELCPVWPEKPAGTLAGGQYLL